MASLESHVIFIENLCLGGERGGDGVREEWISQPLLYPSCRVKGHPDAVPVRSTHKRAEPHLLCHFLLFVCLNGYFYFFGSFFSLFVGSILIHMSLFRAWGWLSLYYTPVWPVNLNRTSSLSPQQGSAPDTACFSCACQLARNEWNKEPSFKMRGFFLYCWTANLIALCRQWK